MPQTSTKLFQNQIVILAASHRQGLAAADRLRQHPDDLIAVARTDGHPLVATANLAGRHVKAIYETEDARSGASWYDAEIAARKCLANSGLAPESITKLS